MFNFPCVREEEKVGVCIYMQNTVMQQIVFCQKSRGLIFFVCRDVTAEQPRMEQRDTAGRVRDPAGENVFKESTMMMYNR